MITYEQFRDDVMQRGAFTSREDAEKAIEATLKTVGERLSDAHARAFFKHLEEPLARKLQSSSAGQTFDEDELYGRVAIRERVG